MREEERSRERERESHFNVNIARVVHYHITQYIPFSCYAFIFKTGTCQHTLRLSSY